MCLRVYQLLLLTWFRALLGILLLALQRGFQCYVSPGSCIQTHVAHFLLTSSHRCRLSLLLLQRIVSLSAIKERTIVIWSLVTSIAIGNDTFISGLRSIDESTMIVFCWLISLLETLPHLFDVVAVLLGCGRRRCSN